MTHAFYTGALRSLVTMLAVTACASHGGAPIGDGGYPPWPPGHYDLRATVSYRMDSDAGTRTERAELRADLFIAPDGSLSLQSSSGLCHGRTQEEMGLDRSRGQGVFYCQDVRYILRPMGGTVGGEVLVSVSEGYRTRGACVRYEQTATGGRVCVEYRWYVDYRNTTKRASLRVTPRS